MTRPREAIHPKPPVREKLGIRGQTHSNRKEETGVRKVISDYPSSWFFPAEPSAALILPLCHCRFPLNWSCYVSGNLPAVSGSQFSTDIPKAAGKPRSEQASRASPSWKGLPLPHWPGSPSPASRNHQHNSWAHGGGGQLYLWLNS